MCLSVGGGTTASVTCMSSQAVQVDDIERAHTAIPEAKQLAHSERVMHWLL